MFTRKLSLLLMLVLLVIAPFSAETVLAQTGREYLSEKGASPVPASRVVFSAPDSLKYSTGSEAGKGDYVVTIDRENTAWADLIGETLDPQGFVALTRPDYGFSVTPPEGTVSYTHAYIPIGSGNDPEPDEVPPTFEEALLASAERAFNQLMPPNPYMKLNLRIGKYDNTYLVPQMEHWLGFSYALDLFCWVDADGKETYEYLISSLQMKDLSALMVEFPALAPSQFIPAANLSDDQKALITIDTANNTVSYHLDSVDTLNGAYEILTGVKSPAGTRSDWTCTLEGNLWGTYTVEELEAGIPLSIPTENDSLTTSKAKLTWRDADGKYQAARTLTITISAGTPTPWPARAAGWTPIPQSRMYIEIANKYPGLDFNYNEKKNGNKLGTLVTAIDPSELPNDQPLNTSDFMAYIIPPEGAVQFRLYEYLPFAYNFLTAHSFRDNIYDYSSGTPEMAENDIVNKPLHNVADHLEPQGMLIYGNSFMSARPLKLSNGRSLMLYFANNANSTTPYRGAYRLFYWYDKDGNMLTGPDGQPLKEYYVIDGYTDVAKVSTAATETLEELRKQNAKYPRLRIEQGAANGEKYYLYFHVIPKSNAADNANDVAKEICYELYMTDESGNVLTKNQVKGLGEVSVYLPYPDGVTFNTVQDYVVSVSHLNSDYSVIETFDGSKLEFTEDGICFTANGFSPYVLSYEPAHILTTTASGDTLTQQCTCGDKATATLVTKKTYVSGEALDVSVNITGDWQGSMPEIVFSDSNGKVLAKAPAEPGNYSAAIESDNVRAEVFISIIAPPQTILPQTGDSSHPLMLLAFAGLCALYLAAMLRKKHA